MSKFTFKSAVITTALLSLSTVASASVVTSIKPLGFIASSIADGVTDTQVIVPPGASPHDYSFRPSDIQKLKSADLVVWVGEDVDMFLDKGALRHVSSKKVLTVAKISEIDKAYLIMGHHHDHDDDHDDHDHDHKHKHDHDQDDHGDHDHKHKHQHDHDEDDDHDELGVNWHVWYSPEISKIIAQKIADKLSVQYPNKKALIKKNLATFNRTLAQQNKAIKKQLAPVKTKGFYVFHDAYSYFNHAYGLNQVGYFTINPLVAPGAKTLAKIKEEITEHKVNCLFAEPQFTPKVIESLSKATGVKVGRLDPMGEGVKLGKNSYANFLQYTADSYFSCLK